jgi:hypothetical protein
MRICHGEDEGAVAGKFMTSYPLVDKRTTTQGSNRPLGRIVRPFASLLGKTPYAPYEAYSQVPIVPKACASPIQKFGTGDAEKRSCFPSLAEGCVVFSVGSNNEWGFEEAVAASTGCHIHVFDCTVADPRVPLSLVDRVTFHSVCIDGEEGAYARLVREAGGVAPVWLKIDAEGFEWEFLSEMLTAEEMGWPLLPQQLSVEFHTAFLPWTLGELGPAEVAAFFNRMKSIGGYVVADRRDNPYGDFASEILLVKTREGCF